MINLSLIAERLQAARIILDLTQETAATRIGVSRRTLQRYEAGHSMDLVTLDKICRGYGLTLIEVISDHDDLSYLESTIRRLGPRSCVIILEICQALGHKPKSN
jgi:transcriptional regulator with XRE-family HTH domain